ncbi:hypothetical protein ACQRET_30110 [Streptomyces koyangensis]|uniref:hypothetical protein n=1 Tax=Streptomyces koyangensis TaxID=188770 RepID=UPI003D034973
MTAVPAAAASRSGAVSSWYVLTAVLAVGAKKAMPASSRPSSSPLVTVSETGASTAIAQRTISTEWRCRRRRWSRGAARAPRRPPTPNIAAITPIWPEGTSSCWAAMMMTRWTTWKRKSSATAQQAVTRISRCPQQSAAPRREAV